MRERRAARSAVARLGGVDLGLDLVEDVDMDPVVVVGVADVILAQRVGFSTSCIRQNHNRGVDTIKLTRQVYVRLQGSIFDGFFSTYLE